MELPTPTYVPNPYGWEMSLWPVDSRPKLVPAPPINSLLTEDDVLAIREWASDPDATYAEIADYFGISKSSVGAIVRRESWRHLPEVAA